jgi:hypothetical protein
MVSWSDLEGHTLDDPSLNKLLQFVESGLPIDYKVHTDLRQYSSVCDSLYSHGGVILYRDRVAVPLSLRDKVVQSRHSAHQGMSTTEQRVRAIVYWPGMSHDIQAARSNCLECHCNASLQAATPPVASFIPSTPFEAVFADYFQYAGRLFLVVGDRLSEWVEVFGAASGTDLAGSNGLFRQLRALFVTFGIPEELSSDGGPEFQAAAT